MISVGVASLLQVGHLFFLGILYTISSPNSSFSTFLVMNQSRYKHLRWYLWKHSSTLHRSGLSENLKCVSSPFCSSTMKFSRQIAHLPLSVSLYLVSIYLIISCTSKISPLSSSFSFLWFDRISSLQNINKGILLLLNWFKDIVYLVIIEAFNLFKL